MDRIVTTTDGLTGGSKITVRNRPESLTDWLGFATAVIMAVFLAVNAASERAEEPDSQTAILFICIAVLLGIIAMAALRFLYRPWFVEVGPDAVTVRSRKWGVQRKASVPLQPDENSVRVVTQRNLAEKSSGHGYNRHLLLCNGEELLMSTQAGTVQAAAEAVEAAIEQHRGGAESS